MWKMAIYHDGQLKFCHYSYYNDDKKNSLAPKRTIESMMRRLVLEGKYRNEIFDSVIFFFNRMSFPQDIGEMYAKHNGQIIRVPPDKYGPARNHYNIPDQGE